MSMIRDLESKIIKEGEVAHSEYAEFAEWCEDRASNLGHEIKTGKSESESLKASIACEDATAATLSAKIEELGGAIATDQHDVQAATDIRSAEEATFAAEEKELMETVDMLERVSAIIQRNMQGGASMMQLKHADNLAQALTVMVQASLIGTSDAAKLTAFAQQYQTAQDTDADEAVDAPAATVYKSHSGDLLETLQNLQEKAEDQLANSRKVETANKQNFAMLKQSLTDEIRFATNDMDEAKTNSARSAEKKATATGDLKVTSKELDADLKTKATLHHDCMTRSESFAAETKSRGEELKAIATAKQVLQEATGVALEQVSLVQVARSTLSSGADLANFEVERLVRDLAR